MIDIKKVFDYNSSICKYLLPVNSFCKSLTTVDTLSRVQGKYLSSLNPFQDQRIEGEYKGGWGIKDKELVLRQSWSKLPFIKGRKPWNTSKAKKMSEAAPDSILLLRYYLSLALKIAQPWKKLSYNCKVPKRTKYVKSKKPESLNDDVSGKCLSILTVLKLIIARIFRKLIHEFWHFQWIFDLLFVSLK